MANRFLSNIRVNDAYTLPASDGSSGQAIITDGAGNLSFGTVSGGGGATASVVYRENFTGDGTTTNFTLTRNITDENITQIYIDGVYQEKDAYSIVSLNTISFTAAPPSGDSIEVMYFYAIDAIPQPSTSVIYRDNFTGDGTTTAFTLANSIDAENHTQVYIDGAYQEKDTYVALGTGLTFTTAPASGHSIEVISIAALTRDYSPTTIYQDNFTGDGTTTAFTLQNAVDDEVKTMIYFNGVYQFKGTYTVSGVTVTFDTAPTSGTAIEVMTISSARGFEYNAQTVYFYGKASGAISKGDAVMFAGQQGDHFLFAKATQAAISANHEYFLGLATQDLTTGEFGYVTEFGSVSGLDTTAYTAGDILWFDAGGSTAGALTTTEPAAPLVKIQVAAVIRSHQDEGVLFVRPTWYHELGELHDVNITSIADKDLLVWDNANGYWKNSKTLGDITVGTLTATNVGGTLTTAAQPNITSVGTLSSLAVSGNLTVDTNTLYVDAANNRVGIGASTFGSFDKVRVTGSNTVANDLVLATPNTAQSRIFFSDTDAEGVGELGYDHASNAMRIVTNGSERLRIDGSGNVGIGLSNPTWKLHVDTSSALAAFFNSTASDTILGINNSAVDGDPQVKFYLNGVGTYTLGVDDSDGDKFKIGTTNLDVNTRLTIDSSGNVGIGTSSPTAFANSTVLAINNTSQGGILELQSNGTSALRVACSASDSAVWEPRAVPFAIGVNNTERLRIGSAGNVSIGSTGHPDYILEVVETSGAELSVSASDSGSSMYGRITMHSTAAGNGYRNYGGEIRSYRGIGIDYSDLRFYTAAGSPSSEKLRILSSGGITFNGDTAAANALDDYEEGAWTPTLLAGGVEPSGISYSVRSGTYVKIGKKVTLWVSIKVNSKGTGSGEVEIGGLPFTVANIAAYKHPMGMGTVLKNNTEVYVSLCTTTRIFFRRLTSTADTPLGFSELDNATFILQTITHEV